MKHVTILVPRGHVSVVNICAARQMLSWVNAYYKEAGRPPLFDIYLGGLEAEVETIAEQVTFQVDSLIDDIKHTDLIILPAIHSDFKQSLEENADLIPWLTHHYKKGAEIASLCIGTFFLAATDLLDGKSCSTHWQYAQEFRKQYPATRLEDEKIVTETAGIYTSGEAFAFTNLMVYLIEKYAGRETAILAAKGFMVDIDRSSQSPFMIFSGQRNHKDEQVLQAQDYIENHFHKEVSVKNLCNRINLGRRTLERRFKKATSNTVLEYLQRVRVEAAKKELEKGRKTIAEVMYDVGYNDTKAFREVFRKVTFMTPLKYQQKYSQAV